MRPASATAASVGGAALLLLALALAVRGAVPAADAAVMAWADGLRHPLLDRSFLAVTWFGSLAVLIPLAGAWALRVAYRQGWRAAFFVPTALLATATLAHVVKFLLDRARPDLFPALTALPADASFPSAHAAQAAAVVLAVLASRAVGGSLRVPVMVAGALLVTAVALSRIYLQVHFPSDVVAGIVLAVGVVTGLRALPGWRGASS